MQHDIEQMRVEAHMEQLRALVSNATRAFPDGAKPCAVLALTAAADLACGFVENDEDRMHKAFNSLISIGAFVSGLAFAANPGSDPMFDWIRTRNGQHGGNA